MEATHTITLTIEMPVVMDNGRHVTDLVAAAESYIERVNTRLGDDDRRREWTSLFDMKGTTVAELSSTMSLTGIAVARTDGETLLQYLSAVIESQ